MLEADHPEGIQPGEAFEPSWATSQQREGPGSPWGQKVAHTPALASRRALLTFAHSVGHKQVFFSFSTLASNMAALPSFELLPQGETRRLRVRTTCWSSLQWGYSSGPCMTTFPWDWGEEGAW